MLLEILETSNFLTWLFARESLVRLPMSLELRKTILAFPKINRRMSFFLRIIHVHTLLTHWNSDLELCFTNIQLVTQKNKRY